ncbi:MAG: zinc-ribbon domain-containing protein [Deltaproteobacteria bacterium]|nr:zinc-ribbon domain-containing protein [Deltaproteobacteria bacterium]
MPNVIVTCQECSTSFQLDDARIPASGARVRCSRCKHAFFLPNPSASQSEAVHAVVEQVVQGKLGGTPEPTRDLGPAARTERSGAGARSEPEEEDWQFSQEIRVAGDDERDEERAEVEIAVGTPSAARADSFDLTGDFGRGFDPETLAGEEAPQASRGREDKARKAGPAKSGGPAAESGKSAHPAPVRDETSFGSIDDFSSLIEDEDLSIDLDAPPRPPPPPRPSARPAARGADATSGAAEDLGDPESWDIVGGEGARRATSRVAALIRPKSGPGKSSATEASRPGGLDLFAEAELPPIRDDLDEASARGAVPWAAVGRLAGWAVTLVSVAVVFGSLVRPEWSRRGTEPQRLEIGPFVAETARVGWVESSRSGLLLVFEGELRNTGSTPLRPIPLQLSLLDQSGERLADPPIEAGMPLDAFTLREASPQQLVAEREESVARWLAAPLSPGEARRFTAVATVEELPRSARRVALEAGRADQR